MSKNDKHKNIKISFVDSMSSEAVTGSNIFVETPNYKILLDCGLYQSNNKKQDYIINARRPKKYKPKDIDFVFISHSHGDHILKLPRLYSEGFHGTTFMAEGTKSVYKRMAEDSAEINVRDIELINNQNGTKYLPLYTVADVYDSMDKIIEKPMNQKIKVNEEISFMFIPSGHLLHSAQILLWITYDNITKTICFTGDIGNPFVDNKYVGKLEKVKKCDLLIGESTYGDRPELKIRQKERKNDLNKIKTIIDTQVCQMQGRVIFASFAQSRSAQLINYIYNLYKDNKDFKYKIYLDSPLAIDLFKDLENHLEGEELEEYINIKNWENLVLIKETIDSKNLVKSNEPCVIISTSGMCQIGRIRHHLKKIISDPNATMVFCGWSHEDSLASYLKNPKNKEVNIDGKTYIIRCASFNLKSLSGHCMFETLVDYYSDVNCNKIILHHGNENAKLFLAKELRKELEKKNKTTRVVISNNSMVVKL